MTTMSLAAYRAQLPDDLSRPTPAQIEDFIEHACHLHSWYKHLPLTPPGCRFTFFLNPCAGMRCERDVAGQPAMYAIGPDDALFGNEVATAEYRTRFGLLDVHARTVALDTPEDVGEQAQSPTLLWHEGEYRQLPDEVDALGSAVVTGIIHSGSRQTWLWEVSLGLNEDVPALHEATMAWPEESGGVAVVQEIRERLLRWQQEPGSPIPDIEALIAPERERQIQGMRVAIGHMLDRVLGG